MFMIMFVSNDLDQASEVLDVWVKSGVEGVTILESAGMRAPDGKDIDEDIGILFSVQAFMRAREIHHRTLLSAIQDEATLQRVVDATTRYVGDWTRPDAGVLFVWPLAQVYGLGKNLPSR